MRAENRRIVCKGFKSIAVQYDVNLRYSLRKSAGEKLRFPQLIGFERFASFSSAAFHHDFVRCLSFVVGRVSFTANGKRRTAIETASSAFRSFAPPADRPE